MRFSTNFRRFLAYDGECAQFVPSNTSELLHRSSNLQPSLYNPVE